MEDSKRMRMLVCENSTAGILSAVHLAFTSRYGHRWQRIVIGPEVNMDLFSDMIYVETDFDKASRVAEAVAARISRYAWQLVWQAAEADSREKGDIIYRFLILGFAGGGKMVDAMSRPEVMGLHKLSRAVGREYDHLRGFLRFQELNNHILYGKLVSRHHVGVFLADHFAGRFPMENWIIHDRERDEVWIHRAGQEWVYMPHPDFKADPETMLSASEFDFKTWWQTFTESIAIRERVNPRLQMQMMPKRYWKYMPEMQR